MKSYDLDRIIFEEFSSDKQKIILSHFYDEFNKQENNLGNDLVFEPVLLK